MLPSQLGSGWPWSKSSDCLLWQTRSPIRPVSLAWPGEDAPKPRPWWLPVCFAYAKRHKGERGRRSGRVARASSPITELLVDADVGSIELFQQAISHLKDMGGTVRTQVFAEPRRTENKKWREFLEEPGITFRAVPRLKDHSREPNDEAIEAAMQNISTRRGVHRIALLTGDADFVDVMMKLQDTKPSYLVLVPEYKSGVAAKYQESGLKVMNLEDTHDNRGPCVRAILHDDGTGSVQLANPYICDRVSYERRSELVKGFLEDLKYTGHLSHACAKFWFTNDLGQLIVFPGELATLAIHKVIKEAPKARSWRPYSEQLAFLLPMGKSTASSRKAYGSRQAQSVFTGGGPLILKDSRHLTCQVLKRLGYLDPQNADEHEAMLCFINSATNKKLLQKMDLLPAPSDTHSDVKEKLRMAFLSDACPPRWQRQTAPAAQMQNIVTTLQKEGFLSKKKEPTGEYCSGYSKSEISEAIKTFVQEMHLPPSKTFNGLAWRIRCQLTSNHPTHRGTVEFGR